MKRIFVTLSLFVSMTALAGKAEREYIKSDVTPAITAAEAKVKASCGCPLKITMNDNVLGSSNDLYQVKHIADAVTEGVGPYCNDAASKKAVCQMKTLEIVHGKETAFAFKGDKGTATTDGNSFYGWDNMAKELDK